MCLEKTPSQKPTTDYNGWETQGVRNLAKEKRQEETSNKITNAGILLTIGLLGVILGSIGMAHSVNTLQRVVSGIGLGAGAIGFGGLTYMWVKEVRDSRKEAKERERTENPSNGYHEIKTED